VGYDFMEQFRVMGTVAKYFGGAASFEYLEKKKFQDIWFLYKIYEYQVTYEEIVNDLAYDDKGKKRTLPPEKTIKQKVEARIKERTEG